MSPPYSGSTLLTRIISSSNNASLNNPFDQNEGQFLPALAPMMRQAAWKSEQNVDWKRISKEWHKYWDPRKSVLVEKGPPNLMYRKDIGNYFNPSFFIYLIRNPYATIQSLMSRNDWTNVRSTHFWLMCAELIYQGLLIEPNRSCLIIYESLIANPKNALSNLIDQIPNLADMTIQSQYNIHNKTAEIKNMNSHSIAKLQFSDYDIINPILLDKKYLLDYFNYSMIPAKR